jgi:hypothetical protein
MQSSRPNILAQAVNSRTWSDYQLRLLLLSIKGLFGKWIPGVLMFLFAVLTKFLQDHYDFTVKSKGWFLVYLPYAAIFCSSLIYHAFRASWLIHHATARQIALTRLDDLLMRGHVLYGDFVGLGTEARDYWSTQVGLWERMVCDILLTHWTEAEKNRFKSLTNLPSGLTAGPTQHWEMLKCWRSNLELLLFDLKK